MSPTTEKSISSRLMNLKSSFKNPENLIIHFHTKHYFQDGISKIRNQRIAFPRNIAKSHGKGRRWHLGYSQGILSRVFCSCYRVPSCVLCFQEVSIFDKIISQLDQCHHCRTSFDVLVDLSNISILTDLIRSTFALIK